MDLIMVDMMEKKKSLRCRLRLCKAELIHNGLVEGPEKRSGRMALAVGRVYRCSECGRVVFKNDDRRTSDLVS